MAEPVSVYSVKDPPQFKCAVREDPKSKADPCRKQCASCVLWWPKGKDTNGVS